MDVILAEHTGLGELRVLKRIVKNTGCDSGDATYQLRREAAVLKGLRLPGIPLIYDYWEDSEEICLIEEYVTGVSLQEYLLRNGAVDFQFIQETMIRILDILVSLHQMDPPLTHQDLKSEHVFIQEGRVILIDYGIAAYLRGSGMAGISDDILALAGVAQEMAKHCSTYIPSWFKRSIRKAGARDDCARYSTAAEWRDFLVKNQAAPYKSKRGLLISKIAVVGNERGVGTTHIAFSVTTYLNSRGEKTHYRNQTGRPFLVRLSDNLSTDFYEKNGIIYHRWFAALPDTGPAVEPEQIPDGMEVRDCGTDFSKAQDADMIIYVTGSRPWQSRKLLKEYLDRESTVLMITPANPGMAYTLAKAAGHRVVSAPFQANPMHPDRRVNRVYDSIFQKFTKN